MPRRQPTARLLPVALAGALAACGYNAAPPVVAVPQAPPLPMAPAGPPHIALLAPLTGPNAPVGTALMHAAQLALSGPNAPQLDTRDTGGDPARAAAAAQAAIAAGDRLILGPLTAPETLAVAAVTAPANVAVLAFTSDPAAASPGVWTLGLTPGQQMRRLVSAARDDGRRRIAAVLPPGPLGDALQAALGQAAAEAGFDPPQIARDDGTLTGFTEALKQVSAYESRRGALAARIKSLREDPDPASRARAAVLAAEPVAPPPFDALLLGETGDVLAEGAETLSFYDVTSPQVRVLGPALWAQQSGRLGRLSGAWYAALDPASRGEFVTAYQARFGAPPSGLADYAFDAAAVARLLAGENDFSAAALTRAEGFTGVDGAFLLLPDGHVRRALAVWQIGAGGGAHIVSPAPQDLSPGS